MPSNELAIVVVSGIHKTLTHRILDAHAHSFSGITSRRTINVLTERLQDYSQDNTVTLRCSSRSNTANKKRQYN